jgi:hypothetical protein
VLVDTVVGLVGAWVVLADGDVAVAVPGKHCE